MSEPTFFTEGSTPRVKDTIWRIEQKILGALLDGGGGGGGGTDGTTNMNLGGVAPPTDGSVPTKRVFDLDSNFSWYNSGTIAAPVWNSV